MTGIANTTSTHMYRGGVLWNHKVAEKVYVGTENTHANGVHWYQIQLHIYITQNSLIHGKTHQPVIW